MGTCRVCRLCGFCNGQPSKFEVPDTHPKTAPVPKSLLWPLSLSVPTLPMLPKDPRVSPGKSWGLQRPWLFLPSLASTDSLTRASYFPQVPAVPSPPPEPLQQPSAGLGEGLIWLPLSLKTPHYGPHIAKNTDAQLCRDLPCPPSLLP